jgi:hypothetical protein
VAKIDFASGNLLKTFDEPLSHLQTIEKYRVAYL